MALAAIITSGMKISSALNFCPTMSHGRHHPLVQKPPPGVDVFSSRAFCISSAVSGAFAGHQGLVDLFSEYLPLSFPFYAVYWLQCLFKQIPIAVFNLNHDIAIIGKAHMVPWACD